MICFVAGAACAALRGLVRQVVGQLHDEEREAAQRRRLDDGRARQAARGARLARLPRVTLYNVEPGPNELLPDLPFTRDVRVLQIMNGPFIRDVAANFCTVRGRRRLVGSAFFPVTLLRWQRGSGGA